MPNPDDERLEFFSWIATEPEGGAVIAGSGGCRKIRWSRPGMGKQGGARVIYEVVEASHPANRAPPLISNVGIKK